MDSEPKPDAANLGTINVRLIRETAVLDAGAPICMTPVVRLIFGPSN